MSQSTTTERGLDSEYEHLRRKRAERRGNVETATVADVSVGESEAVLRLSAPWAPEGVRLSYDLDDDRDVCKLEALTDRRGFDFEQLPHLEGLDLEVVYTGEAWVPTAHEAYVEDRGSLGETFRTELRLLARELARSPRYLRRAVRWVRSLTTQQAIVGAVLLKKLLIVALLAWYLL